MSKDPAFLFYPADASEDTQFMNRLERGAYFDLVKCQRIYHGFTTAQLRKILGADFETVKDSLLLVLEKENETFYIRWVRESLTSRANYSTRQSERAKLRWKNHGNATAMPLIENENGIGNINGINKGGMGEKAAFHPRDIEKPLTEDRIWLESVCMATKLTLEQVQAYGKDFIIHATAAKEAYPTLHKAQGHFVNWLKKELLKTTKNRHHGKDLKAEVAALIAKK